LAVAVRSTSEALHSRRDWESIKARHRLADIARRSGLDVPTSGRVMVCCPTPGHPDSTPSMQLDLDRDRYRCFGCATHGDVIDWVRDVENVDAATAIDILDSRRAINAVFATHASRRITASHSHEPPRLDRTPDARVAAANTLAWRYYSSPALHERGAAYLAERGADLAVLETELSSPVVGHTPSSKTRIDGLTTFLARKGFSDHELIDAGLATRLPDGCVIDFFRDRVIIPVKGPTGAVIGFLGRDTTDRSRQKYLNPPNTVTYQKSRVLYRPSTPRLDDQASTIVCEGPIDALAIAAHAAAAGLSRYFAPVAACGRAMSDAQIDQVLAIHPRAPILAADGDQAGREANLDWANRMLAKGRETVITSWPDDHDPSSWLVPWP
jgi:DNA primase